MTRLALGDWVVCVTGRLVDYVTNVTGTCGRLWQVIEYRIGKNEGFFRVHGSTGGSYAFPIGTSYTETAIRHFTVP